LAPSVEELRKIAMSRRQANIPTEELERVIRLMSSLGKDGKDDGQILVPAEEALHGLEPHTAMPRNPTAPKFTPVQAAEASPRDTAPWDWHSQSNNSWGECSWDQASSSAQWGTSVGRSSMQPNPSWTTNEGWHITEQVSNTARRTRTPSGGNLSWDQGHGAHPKRSRDERTELPWDSDSGQHSRSRNIRPCSSSARSDHSPPSRTDNSWGHNSSRNDATLQPRWVRKQGR
jgi:hypothetical protein